MHRPFSRALLSLVDGAERALSALRRRALGDGAELAPSAVLHPGARVVLLHGGKGLVSVGEHSQVRGELLVAGHGGRIRIGDWCYIGEDTRIWSAESIEIGARVLVSHGCEIHDWNAHSLDPRRRHEQFRAIVAGGHPADLPDVPAAPIRIADDAWIGFGSTILKGVTIGARSIVAARSLVLESVPADVLVAGAPARVIKRLDREENVGQTIS